MPKVLALFFGADNSAAVIAQAVADGARRVRFVEADVRTTGSGDSTHKRVASAHAVSHYDGVVVIAPEDAMGSELATLLDELQREPRVENMVFGLAGATPELIERVARLGAIVAGVSQPSHAAQGAVERASALGARVAKVAGWVRHALGHEVDHSHTH
jgi:hypothetical protein